MAKEQSNKHNHMVASMFGDRAKAGETTLSGVAAVMVDKKRKVGEKASASSSSADDKAMDYFR